MEISFENVSFGYKGSNVLNDISFKLDRPGLVCIIGPNGVGKSTLVKCMNRLLTPSQGTVRLDGKDIRGMPLNEIAERISYVPAGTTDCFSMPVIDAVLVGRHNKHKWRTTDEDLDIVDRTLKLLELEDLSMRNFNQLSAGQHQRVALARGLVQETDIMILDEPTANLDVKHQVYVTQLLKAMADRYGRMIIMICHDLNIAAKYADTIMVMAPPGIIDAIGTPKETVTEERVRRIYGIDCSVLEIDDAPHVVLKSSFADEVSL
ncbi:MAG: ABC transporter ATP-binding protein [archaeon]|nr:ABC transporter ATP-binding protein [archaeon]